MKKISLQIFVIFLTLISINYAIELDSVFVNSDSLENRLVLELPWHFHSGDDSTWASPDYNSSEWDTLNSWFDSDEIRWTGIGWFRKTMVIDSSSRNKSIALQMFHYGASEIYLNGNLVHKFGEVGRDTSQEKNFQPQNIPIVLNLDTNLVYTLAIRYSNQKSISDKKWMDEWYSGNGFRIVLREVNASFKSLIYNGIAGAGINFGISGLYYSLSILYFFLFVFYARRIENLYYSFFTLFLGLIFTSNYITNAIYFGLVSKIVFDIISFFSLLLIFLFYLAFLNSIFYKKMSGMNKFKSSFSEAE